MAKIRFINDEKNIHGDILYTIEEIIDDLLGPDRKAVIDERIVKEAIKNYTKRYATVYDKGGVNYCASFDKNMRAKIKLLASKYDMSVNDIIRIAVYILVEVYERGRRRVEDRSVGGDA